MPEGKLQGELSRKNDIFSHTEWVALRPLQNGWLQPHPPNGRRIYIYIYMDNYIYIYFFFSRMRSKGSRFTLGVWGLRVCSLDVASASATVRNRPQPSATVRNRPRYPRMAVPMGSSAEVVIFGVFRRVVASFRVAGVALRDIQTCFATC